MTRRYLNTLIAVVLLAALWFSFKAWNAHESRKAEKSKHAAAKLLPLKKNQIDSFTLTARDGKSFTCSKSHGKTWSIVKPLPIPADQSKVSSFLDSLTSATVAEVIRTHPANLRDFGLDPAAETLQISTDTNPHQVTLLLGDDTPTSTGVYAQVTGSPRVVTLSEDTKTALEKKLFDLRDTRAVTLDTDKLQSIHVKYGTKSYTLLKNPEGEWEVSLPPAVRADHFNVESLVDDLQDLTMQSVVAEEKRDDAKYGFANPTLAVTLKTPGASQKLVVGKKASQGYYAMNSGLDPVFTLGSDSTTQFEKKASYFRDKDLFSWDMFDVKSFEVTTPKGHWAFQQVKAKWQETAPAKKAVSSDKVNAFLSALRNLTASSFPKAGNSKFGFNEPIYTFKVTFGSKNRTQMVEVAKSDGHIYARRESDPSPSEVAQSDLTTIENTFKRI